ncbi:Transcriptional regulator, TetR family [Leucobacter sp. 7(1)]|uniref:TetR/AcrR family transcriptional regulator n=1 Tax=Leucobacter sp. 7(1) TaxID=1255613 RepID=UPI00097F62C3|nr:TetR/AcrR family transcriptional regulator [Leucobacter sp. 7(1)]SJN08883.1 Transcriptional regulator, TetR family [Leucobacter sp. 7(1)]
MNARRENRERRERALLEAAVAAIAELGLSGVRISDIAERAGMTAGHLNYYFPSKSVLLQRAIEMSEGELVRDARESLSALADPLARLRALCDVSLADAVGDPGWLLWFQVWAESALHPELAEAHHELDASWRELLRQVIADGVAAGVFRVPDVDGATAVIAAMLDGLSIQLAVGAPGYTRDRIRSLAESAALGLLRPAP